MSNPVYKGSGQPTPAASDGLTGWLGGFLGGSTQPAYKTTPKTPTPTPTPMPTPTCKPIPVQQSGDDAEVSQLELDEHGNAVIPVGAGPITIVINPRA